jgi:hypothetical protein
MMLSAYRFVGEHGEVGSLERFSAWADWQTLLRESVFYRRSRRGCDPDAVWLAPSSNPGRWPL